MRASSHPRQPRKALNTSAITGRAAIAGASRSLRCAASQLTASDLSDQSGNSSGIGGLFLLCKAAKTVGVGTSTPGLINKTGQRTPFAKGAISSPMPDMRCQPCPTQTGTSAPSERRSATGGTGLPVRSASARKVAAASDDPPPIPAAAGRCFSKAICAETPKVFAAL